MARILVDVRRSGTTGRGRLAAAAVQVLVGRRLLLLLLSARCSQLIPGRCPVTVLVYSSLSIAFKPRSTTTGRYRVSRPLPGGRMGRGGKPSRCHAGAAVVRIARAGARKRQKPCGEVLCVYKQMRKDTYGLTPIAGIVIRCNFVSAVS